MDVVSFLRSLTVFRALDVGEAQRLVEQTRVQDYAPGSTIVSIGEPGDAMFVLLEGAVEIPVVDDAGRRRYSAYLGPGDLFGEMALLTGEARTADVRVHGDAPARCLVLDRAVVEPLLQNNPKLARFLTAILADRLQESGRMQSVGKYQLLGELSRGGSAIVYEGLHPGLHRSVAIKMLAHDLVFEGEFVDHFQREARLVAELDHPNIVQVFDTERAYATFFIIMERLVGEELTDKIIREGPQSAATTRHAVRAVASALHYAHKRGVVHRDIKPSNIFVEHDGDVKVMDFGIAGAPVSAEENALTDRVMGTPGYVAPEALRGEAIDGRSDMYALGVVAYEMLAGRSAFVDNETHTVVEQQIRLPALDLAAVVPDAPADLVEFVRRATALHPQDRYADCGEIVASFEDGAELTRLGGEVLTVLYPTDRAAEVAAAVSAFHQAVAHIPGAHLARGKLGRFQ